MAVCCDGACVAQAQGRGIAPLLGLYDSARASLHGAIVVDKVVGRAAAAICAAAGVAAVEACLMSRAAADFLATHGIPARADAYTPAIRNRAGTGNCPLEEAVAGLDNPAEMIAAVRGALKRLREKSAGASTAVPSEERK